MPKRILILLGHPDSRSFCGALAEAYASAARQAGHEVQSIAVGDLHFDPVLHHGYRQRQELEPDLQRAREALVWAEHLVVIFPVWWGGMPAGLKGIFDRVFLPGFAFKYRENSPWWDRLLSGRSAHAILTMDTPPWYYRWVYRQPGVHQIRKTILEFCGFKPVKVTLLGPVRHASEARRAQWLTLVAKTARKP